MPINQLGTMGVPEPSMILISPWDPAAVALIDKAIRTSDLGLNPASDGKVVRVPIPPLTEERRKDLVKIVRKKAEDGKVAVRNIRHKSVDELKTLHKDSKVTDDENKRATDHVQKLTDKYTKDIDGLVQSKEKEIMEV